MKPGFEHHGKFTSETARKMLSMRGGRATAHQAALNGYTHLHAIRALSINVKMRQGCQRSLAKLEPKWARTYGTTLLQYLLERESTRNR